MYYHYLSFQTEKEAELTRRWVRSAIATVGSDRIQPESDPRGDLYLGGEWVYVFHTCDRLTLDMMTFLMQVVSTCGHSVNVAQGYW